MNIVPGYNCIYAKEGVKLDSLAESITIFLKSLELELLKRSVDSIEKGGDQLSVVITCGYTQRKNPNGTLTNSLHNFGKAVDFSIYNKDRQQVDRGWTKTDWSILKGVVKSLNEQYKGKYFFQVIFESTEQQDLVNASSMGEGSAFIVATKVNEFYTGPHFHIQCKESIVVSDYSLPEESVDDLIIGKETKPVQETYLKFMYDGPTIKLYDLIKSHPIFRSYLGEDNEPIKEKVSGLLGYCGNEGRGITNFEWLKLSWTSGKGVNYIKVKFNQIEELLSVQDFLQKYYSDNNILIRQGSLIMLPPEDSNFLTTLALKNGVRNQVSYFDKFPVFISEKRREIESDPDYLPVNSSNISGVITNYVLPFFTVWVYSKSKGKVIDVSPYCKSVVVTSPVNGFNSATINISFTDKEGFSRTNLIKDYAEGSYLSNTISNQDLIWIRFESLQSEKGRKDWYGEDSEVPYSEIPGKYYDFIGFVNTIYETQNFSGGIYNLILTAFSLEWALELDKAIFMPLALITNNDGNGNLGFLDSSNQLLKRLSSQGEFLQLSQKVLYTFEEVVKFYLGQIVQVGFLSNDEIFDGYGDRRSTLFEFYPNELRGTVREVRAKGVYQIFKVDIDSYLKGRYFSDRNVLMPNGSVHSLIKSICVQPLVESFFDVYGDTYHLVIRKPPFDYKSIKEYLDIIDADPYGFNTIEEDDIQSVELKWEDNFYTWFQINPEGSTPSIGEYINLLFQIIFVNEYVQTWGSRGLQFSDPYLRDIEVDQADNFSETKAQIISDIIYVLESSLYLPFTRKGRIILNKGDRRIKKGTWIKYAPSDELFYVEQVDQKISVLNQSVSRQTILTVSRGMKIEFIIPPHSTKREDSNVVSASYFNIVNLEGLKNTLVDYINNPSKTDKLSIKSDFVAIKPVFQFFLQKRQMGLKHTQVGFYYE